MDGWKTTFPFGDGLFAGVNSLLVLGTVFVVLGSFVRHVMFLSTDSISNSLKDLEAPGPSELEIQQVEEVEDCVGR